LRIDAHQRFTAEHPAEHFGPILNRNRFVGSVCVVQPDDPPEIVDHDFVLAVVVAGDPARWRAHPKFRGVLWTDLSGSLAPGDTLDLLVRAAEVPGLIRFAEDHADRKIVIDHLGAPEVATGDPAAWVLAMEALARFPNVYCKLSGLVRLGPAPWKGANLQPYVHHALRSFGPERLMFGSGWPDCLPEHAWKETLAAFTQALGAAPITVREELLGGSAARFYSIERPPGEEE
jgi:predicted TIM-barrel fold metal-dependent hydrolase